jgi:hypothetical protein
MSIENSVPNPDLRRPFGVPLPNLKFGSLLRTRRGVEFWVRDAVVLVAESGGESPCLHVERIHEGQRKEMFLTIGMLANLTRGAMHKPGSGKLIHWTEIPRRPLSGGDQLGLQQPPRLLRRRTSPP